MPQQDSATHRSATDRRQTAAVFANPPSGPFGRSLRDGWQAVQLATSRFREARCADAASNLAFTTLVAIVPLLAIGFAIVSAFPVFGEVTEQVRMFASSTLLPEAADRVVGVYLSEFAANAAQVSAIGLVVLVVTALVLVLTIESAFDDIWRTGNLGRRAPRLAVYSMLVTVGPLLIGAGLWLTSLLVSWSMGWFAYLDEVVLTALRLVPFVLTILAFGLLYHSLPNQRVRAGDAAIGGLVAGVLFELTKRAFGLYVTHIGGYHAIYGAFATVPIFLMWVYLSWLVVLMGAALVAVIPAVRAGDGIVPPAPAGTGPVSADAPPTTGRPPAGRPVARTAAPTAARTQARTAARTQARTAGRRGRPKRGGSPRGDRTSSG
jgi:membrane protein